MNSSKDFIVRFVCSSMNHKHPTILTLNGSEHSVVKLISELNHLANQTRVRIAGVSLFSRRDGDTEVEIFHDYVQETHDNVFSKDFDLGEKAGFRDVVKRINSIANDRSVKIMNIVFGVKGRGRRHLEIQAKKLRR